MGFKRLSILAALAVFLFYGLLILSLGYFFDVDHILGLWSSKRTLFTIKISMAAATISAILSLVLAVRLPMHYHDSSFAEGFLLIPFLSSLLLFHLQPSGNTAGLL
jgi:ABC-type sulfate transport system permease component